MRLNRFQKLVDRSPAVSRRLRESAAWRGFQARKLQRWRDAGRPIPPPDVAKQHALRDHATRYRLDTLIETGTFYGGMILAVRDLFHHVHSVELDPWLHARARRLFANDPRVHLHHGDSADVLPEILARLDRPALFWLDAHYSGAGTAKAARETPIAAELDRIFTHPIRHHVILIDVAHDFGRLPDYPPIDELRTLVTQQRPDLSLTLEDDIIRILPTAPPDEPSSPV